MIANKKRKPTPQKKVRLQAELLRCLSSKKTNSWWQNHDGQQITLLYYKPKLLIDLKNATLSAIQVIIYTEITNILIDFFGFLHYTEDQSTVE